MATEEKDNNQQPINPVPKEREQPCKEIEKAYSEKPQSPENKGSKEPLHEGYKPVKDTTNPDPPTDSGTTKKD